LQYVLVILYLLKEKIAMRSGIQLCLGFSALLDLSLDQFGPSETAKRLRLGIEAAGGSSHATGTIRVKELVLAHVGSTEYGSVLMRDLKSYFDLMTALRFDKRSDDIATPKSYKTTETKNFFCGFFQGLKEEEVLLDFLKRLHTTYWERVENLTQEEVDRYGNHLSAMGLGKPAPVYRQGVRHFNDMIRIVTERLISRAVWDAKLSPLVTRSSYRYPSWMPDKFPKSETAKTSAAKMVVSDTVKATKVEQEENPIPVIGQKSVEKQETFLDYRPLMEGLAQTKVVQRVYHRRFGWVIALCAINALDANGKKVFFNANIRHNGDFYRSVNASRGTLKALHEFTCKFPTTHDPKADLLVRLVPEDMKIEGKQWMNRDGNKDDETSSYYRVVAGEVRIVDTLSTPDDSGIPPVALPF
jgi:hypothetical protein